MARKHIAKKVGKLDTELDRRRALTDIVQKGMINLYRAASEEDGDQDASVLLGRVLTTIREDPSMAHAKEEDEFLEVNMEHFDYRILSDMAIEIKAWEYGRPVFKSRVEENFATALDYHEKNLAYMDACIEHVNKVENELDERINGRVQSILHRQGNAQMDTSTSAEWEEEDDPLYDIAQANRMC